MAKTKIIIESDNELDALASVAAYGMACQGYSEKITQMATARLAKAIESYNKQAENAGKAKWPVPTPATAPAPKSAEEAPDYPSDDESPFPEAEPEPEKKAAEKAPTPEDVKAAGVAAAQKFGNAAVKAVLQEFGVERMTEIQEADRAAFIAKVKGLGETNA